MQVTEANADGLKRELKVTIPATEIAGKVNDRLAELSRTVRLPGFRPGHVPAELVKKKFGAAVMHEVVEGAVTEGTRQAMDERQLRPVLQPKVNVTQAEEGSDLEFTVEVETLPEVPLVDFATLELERPVTAVSDAEIDEALKAIASRRERTEPAAAEHEAGDGDVVVIDFLGKVNGKPFAGGKGRAHPLRLGSGSFIPGFEEQLKGIKAGEARTVTVTFPADYPSKFVAGKEALFDVKAREVRTVLSPVLDDEFAKSMGIDDLDALKNVVRTEIEQQHSQLSRLHVKRHLLDALAEKHDFALPEGMIDAEFQSIWRQFERERASGRLDPSDVGKDDETLKAEYRDIAARRVRLGLVLAEISNRNNISVAQADLGQAMTAEARRFPGQEQAVMRYYQDHPEALDSLRAPILEDKVVDFILETAKITDKPVELAELQAEPDAGPDRAPDVPDDAEAAADEAKE